MKRTLPIESSSEAAGAALAWCQRIGFGDGYCRWGLSHTRVEGRLEDGNPVILSHGSR